MIKTGDFGVFVIFTAIFAAGVLGLPDITFLEYVITPGVILSPFVARFGFPSIFGLVLGHFIASTASPLGPIDLVSPASSFLGLLSIRYLRARSLLLGCLVYTILTSAWITYMLAAASKAPPLVGIASAFPAQLMAILLGYAAYNLAGRHLFGG